MAETVRRIVLAGAVAALTAATACAAGPRGTVLIDAARIASDGTASEARIPGRWWLRRDVAAWGAPGGAILLTGLPAGKPRKRGFWEPFAADRFVPYRVPDLVVDPKLRGWYRIHVGLYRQAEDPPDRLLVRLSDEPYGEYLQTPEQVGARTAEVVWKPADLTGRRIHIAQPPAPPQHAGHGWVGGVTHLRFVPMTPAEVKAARKEIDLPPFDRRLFGMLDYTDEVFWWGSARTEGDMCAIVYRHREAGFGRIYWRCFGTCLDNSLAVPQAAPVWTEADEQRWCRQKRCRAGWMPYIDIARRFDPLKVAVEYGRRIGIEVHAWVRFTNFNREPRATFWHENPQFHAQMLHTTRDPKTGARVPVKPYRRYPYQRVLSMAYPEVRAFYVDFCRQIASTGTRGIMIDLLRHPPIAGYEPVVSDAFRKKFGVEMESRDILRDPLVQQHLSEYLRLFLVDLRKAVGDDMEITIRCAGPSNYALRGREWIEAGLIDTIVDGNWNSGNQPRPTVEATVKAAGARGRAFVVAEAGDVYYDRTRGWVERKGHLRPRGILDLAKHYSGRGIERFGLYESTIHTWDPARRRAIRAAGWLYRSEKRTPDQ